MPHKEVQISSVNSSHLQKATRGYVQLPRVPLQHPPGALGPSHKVALIN